MFRCVPLCSPPVLPTGSATYDASACAAVPFGASCDVGVTCPAGAVTVGGSVTFSCSNGAHAPAVGRLPTCTRVAAWGGSGGDGISAPVAVPGLAPAIITFDPPLPPGAVVWASSTRDCLAPIPGLKPARAGGAGRGNVTLDLRLARAAAAASATRLAPAPASRAMHVCVRAPGAAAPDAVLWMQIVAGRGGAECAAGTSVTSGGGVVTCQAGWLVFADGTHAANVGGEWVRSGRTPWAE